VRVAKPIYKERIHTHIFYIYAYVEPEEERKDTARYVSVVKIVCASKLSAVI
jgi:hypothetical protein